MKSRSFLWSLAAVVLAPVGALASNGVTEINQTCAVETGCLAGDSAGFPVSITSAGSYVLTSDLSVPNANTTAIEFSSNQISLDMNGFAIRGVTSCSGSPVTSCAPTGSGLGISGFSGRSSVHDGRVIGMGGNGVSLGTEAHVENVHAESNGGYGIGTGGNSVVTRSSSIRNLDAGFKINSGVARSNTAKENGDDGIRVLGWASVVESNRSGTNDGDGIECDGACNIHDNTSWQNSGHGILCGSSSINGFVIARNAATNNGQDGINCAVPNNSIIHNTAVGNQGDGIESYHSLYLGNNASSNTGAGLRVIQTAEAFNDAYGQNFFRGNTEGDVVGGAFAVDCNRIGTSTVCPP